MELYLNATSPYARAVRVVVLEKGLGDAVGLRWCDPWADDDTLLAVNPIGRVPTLVTDDGVPLTESLLIARHLDSHGGGGSILPAAGLAETLSLAGLGHGLMEAAFNTVIARKHQGAAADDTTLGQRRRRAIDRVLRTLDQRLKDACPAETVTLGDVMVAVALDYLAFRLPEIDWPGSCPGLESWHRRMTARESFRQTRFS